MLNIDISSGLSVEGMMPRYAIRKLLLESMVVLPTFQAELYGRLYPSRKLIVLAIGLLLESRFCYGFPLL